MRYSQALVDAAGRCAVQPKAADALDHSHEHLSGQIGSDFAVPSARQQIAKEAIGVEIVELLQCRSLPALAAGH